MTRALAGLNHQPHQAAAGAVPLPGCAGPAM